MSRHPHRGRGKTGAPPPDVERWARALDEHAQRDFTSLTVAELRAMHMHAGLLCQAVMPRQQPVTHLLRTGLPLCGFSAAIPADWPEGHKWAREAARVTCLRCRERMA